MMTPTKPSNTNMKWKPISSAPTDDTVVLTDCGTCCYVRQSNWGSPVREGWQLCAIGCQPDISSEEAVIYAPRWWMEIPELPEP